MECDKCHKLKHREEDIEANYIKRLNRIEGQVRGISKIFAWRI